MLFVRMCISNRHRSTLHNPAMTSFHETSSWLNDADPPPSSTEPLPQHVDVAIIGGGLTGLAAARALARRGIDTALLEAEHAGWGASSRNGGMVLTGLKLDVGTLIARYGLETARCLFAASLSAIQCVEQLVAEERIDCTFRRCGHLYVAAKPGHMRGIVAEARLLAELFAHPTRLLQRDALPAELGSSHYHGGLLDEQSASLHPAKYSFGLAQAARRAGARLYEGTRVERVQRAQTAFRLHTSHGALTAERVLIATGGYTSHATPALRRKVFPLGSYIIATEQLPEATAHTLIPNNRMVFDSRHLLAYFRLTPDRRMLFGGRAAFFPETPATIRESAAILQRMLITVFPQLHDARITHAWGGTLDAAFDLMPHAGTQNGLHYALGYAGHGVALATYLGTLIGDQIAGEPRDNPFSAIPFPGAPLGLYNGTPWFLPFAGLWYRFLDWLH